MPRGRSASSEFTDGLLHLLMRGIARSHVFPSGFTNLCKTIGSDFIVMLYRLLSTHLPTIACQKPRRNCVSCELAIFLTDISHSMANAARRGQRPCSTACAPLALPVQASFACAYFWRRPALRVRAWRLHSTTTAIAGQLPAAALGPHRSGCTSQAWPCVPARW